MAITLALAGDTMLGRGVAAHLAGAPPESLFAHDLVEAVREADLFVLNLECCISDRGAPWPNPRKPFFFRAPPASTQALTLLGVSCVTLANNHALDFGEEALLDTFRHLRNAGIRCVGAGADERAAREPVVLQAGDFRLGVIGVTDHPEEFSAGLDRPGVAYADLEREVPAWLTAAVGDVPANAVLITPHWGPNMAAEPVPHVRTAARALIDAGATLVAGHSAHLFQGLESRVLYDLGDFIDDYFVDPILRNDLGLLVLVTLDERGPTRLEALPLKLEYCRTRIADGADAAWIHRRFRDACGSFGIDVAAARARLVATWDPV